MQQPTSKWLERILDAKTAPSLEERALFEKTQEFARLVRWIPGLRMIAVSNSLAMYATHAESDIDLFIVTSPHRLWIVRTFLLTMATVLGVRAKPGDEAGKFCFPFFITERHLNLQPIALTPNPSPRGERGEKISDYDVYLVYWLKTLKPILIRNYCYGRLVRINNVELSVPEYEKNLEFLIRETGHVRSYPIMSFLLDYLDDFLRAVSLPRIHRHIQKNGPPGVGIRLDDDIVKLHYTDRREEMRGKVMEV